MNNIRNIIIAIVAGIVLCLGTVEAIECYVCQSEIHPDCESSPPGPQFLKNCSDVKNGPKYEACRKMENWVDFDVLGQKPTKRIIRQCAADVDKSRLCYYRAGFGGRVNVCDCLEDKCNSASIPTSSMLVLGITLIVFLRSIS